MTHIDPPSNLQSKRLSSHVSALERAFGEKAEPVANDPETFAKLEELKKKIMRDREEFIKLYQPAAMNYAGGVLVRLSKRWSIPVDIEQDVPAVWSNLVLRLLEGKFTSFQHRGSEGSFRAWLRRVIATECKGHLEDQGRVLGRRGPRNASAVEHDIDPECFDPDDRTLETTLRGTLISKTYETMEEAGLYGEAVLHWEKRKRKINEKKDQAALSSEGENMGDEVAEQGLVVDLASHLTDVGGKPISHDNAKKYLERGRDLFAKNFIDQVAKYDGMFDGEYDVDQIEETLVELEFLEKQKTGKKGVGDTQFSRRLRRILDFLRKEQADNADGA
jgi:DNA-directed RNA polymerase specialized sigma24 family protein